MIVSLLYVVLAILGLSFLIVIHELGHYFMARRVGMRVENLCHWLWQADLCLGKRWGEVADWLAAIWRLCQNSRARNG